MNDYRPESNDDACPGRGRSKSAPAGRIPIPEAERADSPHAALFIVRHVDSVPCPHQHG